MKLTARHVTGSDVIRIVRRKDQLNSREVYKQHRVQRLDLGYGAPHPCTIYNVKTHFKKSEKQLFSMSSSFKVWLVSKTQ